VTAATVLGAALMFSLGCWQLRRAALKESLQAAIEAQGLLPVLSMDAKALGDSELLHRRVAARGVWLPQYTVFLDNRQMQGHPGFYVVTPLRVDEGLVVLVQRGWVPRNFEDRTKLPDVATPAGTVDVQGLLSPPPAKLYDFGGGKETRGAIRQNLDMAQFRAETGLSLVDFSIQQNQGLDDGLLRDWPRPDSGAARNYGYALQWFGFGALMIGLYVWFQIIPRFRRSPVELDHS
jgi:surfeit locus 1 family protein